MLSNILADYYKRIEVCNVLHVVYRESTLEHYVKLHGTEASRWASVYLNDKPLILVEIPTDLKHGRYCLMPLCNSQRRLYVYGTSVCGSFTLHKPI